ncbi:Ger(x)C family spore germination protein [Metabacillus indicus]|uniref:Ger(x)C family spore germination protein n=1 Tax=Metabacillus indicus TaxID=246786 RepID=UPI003CFA0984
MNYKRSGLIILFMLNLFITGCWDQRLLKEGRLVYSSAFDLVENEQVKATAVIRDFVNGTPTNVIVQGKGNTVRETRMHMDNKVSGVFEPSKNRVFLLGKELAEKDIYQFLDIFYRDPNSSISAHVAVVDGEGAEILEKVKEKNVLISEFIIELITNAESSTIVPKQNLQTICTVMFDEGKDFAIPLIKMQENEVVLNGTGIFHKKSLVGSLSVEESTIFLLLDNQIGKVARFVTQVKENQKYNILNFVTYNISKSKSKIKFKSASPANIEVEISMKADVSIVEYPSDKLADEKVVKELNKKISKELTKKANAVIKKIQAANSDLFGIGRQLIAFHPNTWKEINWDEEYPSITITPKIEVEIVGHGIIN